MKLTKEEVKRYLAAALDDKAVSVFIQKEKGGDLYIRLELLEYMQTVLVGLPVFIQERQQDVKETTEEQETAGKREEPKEKVAKTCNKKEASKCQSDLVMTKSDKDPDKETEEGQKVAKKLKPERLRLERSERRPKPDIPNEKGDDIGMLIALMKAGKEPEWIADEMRMAKREVLEEIQTACEMRDLYVKGRSIQWIAERLKLPIGRVEKEIELLKTIH